MEGRAKRRGVAIPPLGGELFFKKNTLVYFRKKMYNKSMTKRLSFILMAVLFTSVTMAAVKTNSFIPKKFTTVTSHDDVYPYRLNNAQPANTNKKNISTNTAGTTSTSLVGKRNIVKRQTNARAAATNTNTYPNNNPSPRRVVPRTAPTTARVANTTSNPRISNGRNVQTVATRKTPVVQARTTTTRTTSSATTGERVSSQRCFADYKECMEMYCLREDTAYNRCYCSAKLSQIDAEYQNKIDDLIQQIIKLQYSNPDATSEEIKEYWDQTIGIYTHTNPWVNIENALNIEWPDSQSRIRGQNAFNTGHEYCVRHLRACSYMATNMRDAYKSEIARDCEAYEKTLQKIENAAESVIESYKN